MFQNLTVPLTIEEIVGSSDDGNRLVGRATLFGTHFHVDLVRLVKVGGRMRPPPGCDDETRGAWKNMQRFYDGPYMSVEIPGLAGRWALFLHPFGA